MTGPGALTWFEEPLPEAPPGHVTVEVIGCGVCHTDLGYLYDGSYGQQIEQIRGTRRVQHGR